MNLFHILHLSVLLDVALFALKHAPGWVKHILPCRGSTDASLARWLCVAIASDWADLQHAIDNDNLLLGYGILFSIITIITLLLMRSRVVMTLVDAPPLTVAGWRAMTLYIPIAMLTRLVLPMVMVASKSSALCCPIDR